MLLLSSLSVNMYVNFSDTIRAAGFYYTSRVDTYRCVFCRLEVSHWTYDMDPFTVHLERSPHCAFVRSIQSSNHFQAVSLSTIDSTSERPAKRQKIDERCYLNEVDLLKQYRRRTFFHWPHPILFRSQLIEAGFFGCNIDDRVICVYCNLMCHKWDIEIDDPCEVHKKFSPKCPFVTSMTHWDNKVVPKLPSYTDYVDPKKRLASFATWSNDEFPSKDKLVDAGFFHDGSKIICFYCNGSFESWQSNNPPIAEHVRWFPHCNYARQLCGEELYHKIQQAMKHKSGNTEIGELKNVLDDDTLAQLVADRLDLPISRYLLEEKKIPRSIIERCWMDQLRLQHDDFVNGCDLQIACEILQKQIQLIDKEKKNIIIPSISMKRQISFNSNQSYSDILKSFENDLQTYKYTRQRLALQFTEDKTITIEREHSLINWSYIKPSRRDITKGGWIISDKEDHTSRCSHCHMEYYNWKSDDNPIMIHQYLSPLCLFILSPNPFNSNPIPIRKVGEQFTDEDIENAESRPYAGLVQARHESFSRVSDRQISFDRFPHDYPINIDQLAMSGFFYTNHGRFIRCFYCKCCALVPKRSSQSNQYFRPLHLLSRCRYIQQFNDVDPEPSIQQVSNKCAWCMTEDRRLLALPCRHFCLCELCGQIKRLCPICKKDVIAYVTVYPA